MLRLLRNTAWAFGLYLVPCLLGEQPTTALVTATDPNYVLIAGDTVALQLLEESDMAGSLLIDKDGQVRPPLLPDLVIAGQSIRNAEKFLEQAYVSQEILKRPQVRLNVVTYAPRVISVLGAVRNPGKVSLNRDANSIDIVDAINLAGGFSPAAKKDQVTVIRTDAQGKEESFVIDVDSMISGKKAPDKPREFAIKPSDRIIIKERVF